jgi:hypothetical protein
MPVALLVREGLRDAMSTHIVLERAGSRRGEVVGTIW